MYIFGLGFREVKGEDLAELEEWLFFVNKVG